MSLYTFTNRGNSVLRKPLFASAIMAFSEFSLSFRSNLTSAATSYFSLGFCYGNWLALSDTFSSNSANGFGAKCLYFCLAWDKKIPII